MLPRRLYVTRVGLAAIELSSFQRGKNAEFADDEHAFAWSQLRTELVCRIFEESSVTFVFGDDDMAVTLDPRIRLAGFEFEFEKSRYRAVRVQYCSRELLRAVADDQNFELGYLDIVRMPIDDESRLRRFMEDLRIDFFGTPKPAEEWVHCMYDALLIRWLNPNITDVESLQAMFGPTCEFCGFEMQFAEIKNAGGSQN